MVIRWLFTYQSKMSLPPHGGNLQRSAFAASPLRVRQGAGRLMDKETAANNHKDMYSAINKATLVILTWTFLDKVLAVAKEMLQAREFGIEVGLDVFNLAFAVPGLTVLLIDVAVYSAFVPLYSEWRQRFSEKELRDRTMTVFVVGMLGIFLIAMTGYAMAPWFFPPIAHGMAPAQQHLGVAMVRTLMLLIVLEGASVLFAALLQAWKLFAVVTLAQSAINISLILFLIFARDMGIDLLVWGTLAGCAAKLVFLFAWVSQKGFHFFRPFSFAGSELSAFLSLALPLMGSALIVNSILVVDQSMATQVSAGGVSSLRYAYRINDLPLQLLVIAITRAIFPYISDSAAKDDRESMRYVFNRSLIFIGLISFPMTVFVVIFAPDIVSVLLKRGAFGEEAALRTTLTLQCYVLGLYFFAYGYINGAFFSALKRARTLLFMGVLFLLLNVALNVLFIWLYKEVYGIALSSSLSAFIVCVLFIIMLHKQMRFSLGGSEIKSILLPLAVAAILGAVCYLLRGMPGGLDLPQLVSLLLWAAFYFLGYAGLLLLFRTPEIMEVLAFAKVPACVLRFFRREC